MFCYLRRLHYLCIRFAALGNLKVNFHCTRLQNLCIEKLNKMARRLRKKRIAIILLTFTAIVGWTTHSCVSR